MGNRFLRKKTLKVKQEMSEEQRASSVIPRLDRGIQRLDHPIKSDDDKKSQGNGHIWCGPSEHFVSIDVCIVNQIRMPSICKGCRHFKEVA